MTDATDHLAATDPTDPTGAGAPAEHRRRYLLIAVLAIIVIAVDQLTKVWAVNELSDRTIPIVWTLQLNLVSNTGAAFSLGRGNDLMRFLPLLVLGVVGYLVWRGRQAMTRAGGVAIGMILGGAVGNLIDRALRADGGEFFSGGVIDFIDFQWWPVFNVADMGVVVGGALLVLVSLRTEHEDGKSHNSDREARPVAGESNPADSPGAVGGAVAADAAGAAKPAGPAGSARPAGPAGTAGVVRGTFDGDDATESPRHD